MKFVIALLLFSLSPLIMFSQGCSDAGICTPGNFTIRAVHNKSTVESATNELDIVFTYATHGKQERFYQPQLNYRFKKQNGSFFEFRVPLNGARNTASGISNSGPGDLICTYNNQFSISGAKNIVYSFGLKISTTRAAKQAAMATESYPMYLQNGLGTSDLLAVAEYPLTRFLRAGAGIQIPFLQYNKHKRLLTAFPATTLIYGEGYRRKPDALLRLTAHYSLGKFTFNGSVLGIFHLADDYYKTDNGKYILSQSGGSTYNTVLDLSWALSGKTRIGLLGASPFKTRKNIPDGLARSYIISPKLSISW